MWVVDRLIVFLEMYGGLIMNLCIASSWDDELLEGLSQINSQNETIHELFGSLRQSLTGSGHSSVSIRGKCNTREEVENYVRKIHSHGFKFNYTLNASCLQNMEYDKEGHRELIEHIEWINDIADENEHIKITAILALALIANQDDEQFVKIVPYIDQLANDASGRVREGVTASTELLWLNNFDRMSYYALFN